MKTTLPKRISMMKERRKDGSVRQMKITIPIIFEKDFTEDREWFIIREQAGITITFKLKSVKKPKI